MTQLIGIAGAKLPEKLIGATKDNLFGHWEPVWLNDRNEQLLQDLGTGWDEWSAIDLDAAPGDLISAYVSEMRGFLQREQGDAPLMVLKEPRTCRLLPPILRALKAEKIEPLVVIPYRNPLEVAGSLQARDKIALREGVMLWLRHLIEAERDSRSLKRSFTAYDDVLDDWRGAFAHISKDLGIDWPKPADEIAKLADKAIVRDARHNKWTDEDLAATAYTNGLALRAFDACKAFQADPDSAEAMAQMDQIAGQFDELVELTLPAIIGTRRKLTDVSADADHQRLANETLTRRNEELHRNLEGIWDLHRIVGDLNRKSNDLINELRAQLEEKTGQINSANAQLKAEAREKAEAEARETALNAQLTDLQSEAEATAARLQQTESSCIRNATRRWPWPRACSTARPNRPSLHRPYRTSRSRPAITPRASRTAWPRSRT